MYNILTPFYMISSTKTLVSKWTNQHNWEVKWDSYEHSNLLPMNWADLSWKNTLCRGTVIPTKPPDGSQASRDWGTEGGQGMNLFLVCDNMVTHIERHCRSEIISHFTLIISNLSQHDLEKQMRAVRALVDVSHGGMYRSSWHPVFSIWFQLDIKLKSALRQTKPREAMGHSATLSSCA